MNKLQEKLDQLKWLQQAGIEYYCSERKDSKNSLINTIKQTSKQNIKIDMPKIPSSAKPSASPKKQKTLEISNNASASRSIADNTNTLEELKNAVENFDGCELKKFANNTVFSDGSQNAKILLIGEAPGATEDEKGIPFCGESGILLDKMLETIGLNREQNIYITNTIFWRPPANRRPTPEEIEICKPFVEKHISLLAPELIILVGGTATASMLGKKESISDIRKNYFSYTNQYLKKPILTTALFHPAFLLRQPSKKKDTWFDLLKIRDYLQEKNII